MRQSGRRGREANGSPPDAADVDAAFEAAAEVAQALTPSTRADPVETLTSTSKVRAAP